MGLLIGKFCQFFADLSAHNMIMAGYYHFMFLLIKLLETHYCIYPRY